MILARDLTAAYTSNLGCRGGRLGWAKLGLNDAPTQVDDGTDSSSSQCCAACTASSRGLKDAICASGLIFLKSCFMNGAPCAEGSTAMTTRTNHAFIARSGNTCELPASRSQAGYRFRCVQICL